MGCAGCSGKITGKSYSTAGMTREQRLRKLAENVKKVETPGYQVKIKPKKNG